MTIQVIDPLTPDEARRRNILLGLLVFLTTVLSGFVRWTSYQQNQSQQRFQQVLDRQTELNTQQAETIARQRAEQHDLLCADAATRKLLIVTVDAFFASSPNNNSPAYDNLRRSRDEAVEFTRTHPVVC